MMHPNSELRVVDPQVGLGVYATEGIPKGTVLWVRDAMDHVLSEDEVAALPSGLQERVRRLGYRDASARWIVCWDGGKHVNHACEPTMRGVGHDAMVAIVDVAPGDQITCDYAECNLEAPLTCLCGAPRCRGIVEPEVTPTAWAEWQREVAEAIAHAAEVAQPLASLCVDLNLPRILAGALPIPDLKAVALASPTETRR